MKQGVRSVSHVSHEMPRCLRVICVCEIHMCMHGGGHRPGVGLEDSDSIKD